VPDEPSRLPQPGIILSACGLRPRQVVTAGIQQEDLVGLKDERENLPQEVGCVHVDHDDATGVASAGVQANGIAEDRPVGCLHGAMLDVQVHGRDVHAVRRHPHRVTEVVAIRFVLQIEGRCKVRRATGRIHPYDLAPGLVEVPHLGVAGAGARERQHRFADRPGQRVVRGQLLGGQLDERTERGEPTEEAHIRTGVVEQALNAFGLQRDLGLEAMLDAIPKQLERPERRVAAPRGHGKDAEQPERDDKLPPDGQARPDRPGVSHRVP
jgi:hypothetical protein